MYEKEVKELRAKKLKEYKIARLAQLEDELINAKKQYEEGLKAFEQDKKHIESMTSSPKREGEGSTITYNPF